MPFDDEPQSALEVIHVSHADGFSDQTGDSVAPLVVQAFDNAGFAAAFVAGPVLPGSKPPGIGFVDVTVNQFSPIIGRQRKPQVDETLRAAVANAKTNDLPRQARARQPQIAVAPLETEANDQLINLQRIAFDGRQQRARETQTRWPGLFLRISRTVVRATPKVRAMARCESRSCSAAAIRDSFSLDKVRLRA